MKPVLEQLAAKGCDIEAAMARTLNDEDFLLECIVMVIDDAGFATLGSCLEANDVTGAFESAHSLKGICANTGLTPLVTIVSDMTETLRAGSLEGVSERYQELMDEHAALSALIKG